MPVTNINRAALEKFYAATSYAQQIKDDPTARGGDSVVHLQNGSTLTCNYSETDAPRGLFRPGSRKQEQKDLNNATRAAFKQAVIDIFGTSINDVPKRVRDAMNLSKFDNAGRPLTARRILAVNDAIDAAMTSMAKKFGITGGAAGGILSMVASNSEILRSPNPAREFKARVNRNAAASIATHIASRASENLDYASFELDVNRGMGLTFGGRRVPPKDIPAARDGVAQFLTGNKAATFDGLDEPTRRKACILMSLLHQGSLACLMTGVSGSFEREAGAPRLIIGQANGGDQFNSFSVTKDKAGNITIKGQVTFTGPVIVNLFNGADFVNTASDADGFAKFEGTIRLSAADLDKLADADWKQYDGTEVTATDNDDNLPDHFRKAADKIPEPYKFTGSVDVSFKLHADELQNVG